ncbi:asparaginase [Raineyella sp. LH-20]|uniref:asparaginase n=1 Tax=Raineyella sp. LH-20 TaxID=3081204 RepID=UPI002955D8E6|nr:asparaginase [Raineyella sp. LH-20]WOP19536.1 asparaginase [Raineyella sp. LH-20]
MSPSVPLPTVLFASLGGTISMTGADGVVPSLTAADVIAAAPGIDTIATIEASTVVTIPGASLTFRHLEELLAVARHAVDCGAVGVVVSQGTDTIEETAYYLGLRWDRDEPLVVTGAMRPLHALSTDGPSNVAAAVIVACDEAARGIGVTVVLNEEVHAAAWVRKEHSSALGAFRSHPGPLGYVVEGRFEQVVRAQARPSVPAPLRDDVRVAFLGTGLDDDGTAVRAVIAAGVDGLVVDGFGAAHLPERVAAAITEAAQTVPVVVSSRTGAGRTLRSTYGFKGSERDLAQRGAILSGWLDGRKSRTLLRALLAAELPPDQVRAAFLAHGEL